jgi:hypothetical protein
MASRFQKIVDPLFVECESAQAKFVDIREISSAHSPRERSGQGPCDRVEMLVRDARQVIEDAAFAFHPLTGHEFAVVGRCADIQVSAAIL